MLEEPAGPALPTVPYRIISATNLQLGPYTTDGAQTSGWGVSNTTAEYDGGNYSGNKMLASLKKAQVALGDNNIVPIRPSNTGTVTMTIYTNNPG